jgi:hypothetical protein
MDDLTVFEPKQALSNRGESQAKVKLTVPTGVSWNATFEQLPREVTYTKAAARYPHQQARVSVFVSQAHEGSKEYEDGRKVLTYRTSSENQRGVGIWPEVRW